MRILFMGTPQFAVPSLETLLRAGHDICGVFCQPDKPKGRGHRVQPPPVKEFALREGVKVYQPVKLRDGEAERLVKALAPELIAVVAYGRILPDEILHAPPLGVINIHGSILPKYRGAAPIQWTVINGDTFAGVTCAYLETQLDSGDIIEAVRTPVREGETSGELFDRLSVLGGALLGKVVHDIAENRITRTAQDHSKATLAPQLTREMADIDFTRPSAEIACLVRGLDPWPAARAQINGRTYKVFRARACSRQTALPPGAVVEASQEGVFMACGGGEVVVFPEIQAENGRRMRVGDYLRGNSL